MIYTVEPEGARSIIASYIIQGVAKQSTGNKRPLKQAPALTVVMVLRLHAILRNTSEGIFDRLAAGLMLMCVYGRCRCSDLRFVQEICLDVTGRHGFIEAMTEHHKTANREKRRLLPIVAPAFGITDENWAEQFLTLRNEVLGKFTLGPFLPAPLSEDTFSVRHIESDEFTSLLRYLLRDIPDIESLTSHSCKETVLAWMAKFGADKPTLYFLGRHVGTITSSDIYARGMQSRPLRKLAMALNAIRTGTFAPDETRSGQFRSRESCQPPEPLLKISPSDRQLGHPPSRQKARTTRHRIVISTPTLFRRQCPTVYRRLSKLKAMQGRHLKTNRVRRRPRTTPRQTPNRNHQRTKDRCRPVRAAFTSSIRKARCTSWLHPTARSLSVAGSGRAA